MGVLHRRRSLRLQGYDYSSAGAYFVSICAKDRVHLFGEIIGRKMRLSDAGKIVTDTWLALPGYYSGMRIDAFVVMPNHVHGIICLLDAPFDPSVGAIHESPLLRRRMTIPLVIGRFKMTSAKQINALRKTPGVPVWQRNYHERIVRDADSLDRIRLYITENPSRWVDDPENTRRGDS